MPEARLPENTLTIVVVTYNSAAFVRGCIESLLAHAPKVPHRIVFVDNASSDDTVRIVKEEFPQIELVELEENIGFGRGNNAGFAHAPARYYYCHNADAYLQDDILDKAVEAFEQDPKLGIAGLPLVYPDHSPQTSAYAASTPMKWALQGLAIGPIAKAVIAKDPTGLAAKALGKTRMGKTFAATHSGQDPVQSERPFVEEVDWVCGAAFLLRHELLETFGYGFDPDIFMYGEDEEFCLRASSAGWRIAKLNTTPVIHEFGWGKSVKSSRRVVDLKFDGLTTTINKTFADRPFSRAAMHAMLRMKYAVWKSRSASK
ncbi:glycosyltransferase family 2 protein [Qipengyuania flava]|uniref:glycosyltransferase family 2 protein n=1 Tax=Qipengyuania flava TaxID=192812 RepID=UPI001C6308BD|nr:glycosyltransferase family 2 protein [Qipengyuania flava]QYJ06360.1 glycosyltransferase family 2 protein [Qipengyuania flava]